MIFRAIVFRLLGLDFGDVLARVFKRELVRLADSLPCGQTFLEGIKGLFFFSDIHVCAPEVEISRLDPAFEIRIEFGITSPLWLVHYTHMMNLCAMHFGKDTRISQDTSLRKVPMFASKIHMAIRRSNTQLELKKKTE